MVLRVWLKENLQQKSLQNAMQIASSLRRRIKLAEKKVALLAYCKEKCKTQKDLEDRAEFLRLLRKQLLLALRQQINGNERGTARPRLESCDTSSGRVN